MQPCDLLEIPERGHCSRATFLLGLQEVISRDHGVQDAIGRPHMRWIDVESVVGTDRHSKQAPFRECAVFYESERPRLRFLRHFIK